MYTVALLRELVRLRLLSNRTVAICARFANITAADKLLEGGIRFSGCVKHATRKYPMFYLSSISLNNKSDFVSAAQRNSDRNVYMIALVLRERDWRYLVSTTSIIEPADPSHQYLFKRQNKEHWMSK